MAKKRKRKADADSDDAAQKLAPAPGIATSIGSLLERAGLSRAPQPKSAPPTTQPRARPVPEPVAAPAPAARPRAPHTSGELAALNDAYRGVQPIARPKHARVTAQRVPRPAAARAPDPGDAEARERLSALVGGGVRFDVRWDDGLVEGVRAGSSEKLLRRLAAGGFEPQATLDLHGMRRAQALRAVHDFVRVQRRGGAQQLLVIVGKGSHSEGGVGVLGAAAVEALTQSGAAPLVAAFASAHARHGGSGAIAVLLG
jgi:DNA-nicking Smr family endonuclease